MGVEAELELLKRQNRRLKVALFTIPVAIVVVGVIVSSLVAVRAQRLEERARAEAERALRMAEVARVEAERRSEVEP
jgi:cytochrome c-type biogenesis protein CcmH/NrfF